jgi:hypothetical protein
LMSSLIDLECLHQSLWTGMDALAVGFK